jgi:hypothetical protein
MHTVQYKEMEMAKVKTREMIYTVHSPQRGPAREMIQLCTIQSNGRSYVRLSSVYVHSIFPPYG